MVRVEHFFLPSIGEKMEDFARKEKKNRIGWDKAYVLFFFVVTGEGLNCSLTLESTVLIITIQFKKLFGSE